MKKNDYSLNPTTTETGWMSGVAMPTDGYTSVEPLIQEHVIQSAMEADNRFPHANTAETFLELYREYRARFNAGEFAQQLADADADAIFDRLTALGHVASEIKM